MRGLTAEERLRSLDSFLEPADSNLTVIDRSECERWSVCPYQAKEVELGRAKIVGTPAVVGEAIHQALSSVTQTYIDSRGAMSAHDLRQDLEQELRQSRPDLQPDAIAGMRASLWAWSKFLESVHFDNILRFDGGEGKQSGQLAYDVPDLGCRITSELDLVHSSPSPHVIEWLDYKTGHAWHTERDVADSFQFQFHAVLLLHNYPAEITDAEGNKRPGVMTARLTVWDTRTNHQTYSVDFPRSKLIDYESRVRSALESRRRHWDDPPTWPTREKCAECDVAARCPAVNAPLSQDSHEILTQLIATEAKADALREILTARVDASGQDIRVDGTLFGRQKPKAERRAAATLYTLKGKATNDSDK